MASSELKYNFCSARNDENDEVFILYESKNRTERIVLHRSIEQQLEYIMMSPNLVRLHEVKNPTGTNILFMNQYHVILRHKRNIQNYLIEQGNLAFFYQFLGMSTSEFFDSISLNI